MQTVSTCLWFDTQEEMGALWAKLLLAGVKEACDGL
jgi:hypothetical protein